jgi:asparagine synthase (glutamine-hydrolysing)
LAKRVDESVKACAQGEELVAVAFSGGLDSSMVAKCASVHTRVVGCSAFAPLSGDSEKVPRAAKALGLELKVAPLARGDVIRALGAIDLPFEPTLMDRSLWCLYYVVSRIAKESGARVMLLGQLADELFGGYAKYSETLERKGEAEARAMMQSDFLEYPQRGRVRDVGACEGRVEPRFPFGSPQVVELASNLPTSFMLRHGVRKAVLRRAAVMLGVPEELAGSAKKAAQYSSGVQKLVAASDF